MQVDVAGKVANTLVPRTRPLMPVFEAIVNSFQALQEGCLESEGYIRIEIARMPSTVPEIPGDVANVTIEDNGAGFNQENYDSFLTSDSRHRAQLGGKGVGRFTWLKVFNRAEIDSIYRNGSWQHRSFAFSISGSGEDQVKADESADRSNRTVVRLVEMRAEYRSNIPADPEQIALQIIEHCLLILSHENAPRITLVDSGVEIDLNKLCARYVGDRGQRREFTINGHEFTLLGLRVYGDTRREHRVHYAAHGRTVTSEKLERFIPNLQGSLGDEAGERFVYSAFIQGALLDATVDSSRSDFQLTKTLSERIDSDSLFLEPCLEEVRQRALALIADELRVFLDSINAQKRERVEDFVRNNPQYRPLLKDLDEFIDQIPPTAGPKRLDELLNDQLHQRKVQAREETAKVLSNLSKDDESKQDEAVRSLMEKITQLGMSALAEYVANRRLILEFLERSLTVDPASGRHRLERVLHNVVFPMRTTSHELAIENQNLWLIDERLTHHVYLASDKKLSAVEPLASASDLRPDILLFDKAHTFSESSTYPVDSFVVIEFKRPAHTDYRKDNPIEQVYEQIRQIRTEHYRDRAGREIKLVGKEIPAYAFVIADLTEEMERFAENANLTRTPDRQGYFGFNDKLDAYVEVISYDKLVGDAKKRNRAFFERLGLPSHL